jgi:exosortase/archaeosortase family protein
MVKKITEIEYKENKYDFSSWRVVLFLVITPILSLFFWYLTKYFFYWTHDPVGTQTAFLANLFFPENPFGWEEFSSAFDNRFPSLYELFRTDLIGYRFTVDGRTGIQFTTMCTGVQAIAIFAGLIIVIPRSKNPETNRSLWWRKILALSVSSAIFYVVNIARMILQISLYYRGWNWDDIHVSISAASSFIAALIIILMHRWIPEFIISIIWTLGSLKEFFKGLRKNEVMDSVPPTPTTM